MSCRQRFPPKCVAPTPSRSASRAYGRNALAFLRGVRRANRLCTLSGPHFPNALWRKPQPSDSGTSGLEGTKTLGRRLSLRLLRPPLHRLVLRRPPFAVAHSDPPIACFVLLRRTRIQSVPPSLLPRAVVSPSKQSVPGGTALPGDNCLCTAVALSPPTCQTFTEQKHLFHKAASDPCHALRRQISSHRIPMCPTMPTAPLRMDCEFRLREVILGRARRAFHRTPRSAAGR